jgi:hypothetical protein
MSDQKLIGKSLYHFKILVRTQEYDDGYDLL